MKSACHQQSPPPLPRKRRDFHMFMGHGSHGNLLSNGSLVPPIWASCIPTKNPNRSKRIFTQAPVPAERLHHLCLLKSPQQGDKIRSGYLTPNVLGGHVWVELLPSQGSPTLGQKMGKGGTTGNIGGIFVRRAPSMLTYSLCVSDSVVQCLWQ